MTNAGFAVDGPGADPIYILLYHPNVELRAAGEEAWEGKDPDGVPCSLTRDGKDGS